MASKTHPTDKQHRGTFGGVERSSSPPVRAHALSDSAHSAPELGVLEKEADNLQLKLLIR